MSYDALPRWLHFAATDCDTWNYITYLSPPLLLLYITEFVHHRPSITRTSALGNSSRSTIRHNVKIIIIALTATFAVRFRLHPVNPSHNVPMAAIHPKLDDLAVGSILPSWDDPEKKRVLLLPKRSNLGQFVI